MQQYNRTLAIIFIIVNFLPFILGIVCFFLIIPIPGIILYVFYWRILNPRTSNQEIRNIWLATAIYNLALIVIFQNDLMGFRNDFSKDEIQWTTLYQSVAGGLGILSAYLNHAYTVEMPTEEIEEVGNQQEIIIEENHKI